MKMLRCAAFVILTAAVLTSGSIPAQTAPASFLNPPANQAVLQPKVPCTSLRSLTTYDFSIESAALIPASAEAPERCRVLGQILPEIQFEVNLPATWNRRFYMFGNGGYAGESLDTPRRVATRIAAVQQGFVTADTNTGHDAASEPLGTFAQNRQKLLDYAFRSLHTTAMTGKRVAEAYFGAAPTRSYYEGCSTGGRQGLILAQRFPEDFDGIVAGAPVLNFTGTMISYAQRARALTAAPVPYAKLSLLAERIYAICDGQDGLNDGLIDDPRQCNFQPARDLPKCADNTDQPDCFSSAQIGTLEKIYSDVTSRGKRVFPGWPIGAEVKGPNGRSGWDGWIINERNQPTISVLFGETFFRYLAYPQKDPNYTLPSFDLEKDLPRLEWIHAVLDATDTDLSRFKQRGGKLLMYFGWADPALNAQTGVDYYESVVKEMGASTVDFFRMFMVPGMFHCGGGVGCGSFDKLAPLMQWVEQGIAPERLTGTCRVDGKPARTRPLCPYPQVAKYTGTGSTDDAANFICK